LHESTTILKIEVSMGESHLKGMPHGVDYAVYSSTLIRRQNREQQSIAGWRFGLALLYIQE
jgi:hypothetical protein